jgi:hypothetical protein
MKRNRGRENAKALLLVAIFLLVFVWHIVPTLTVHVVPGGP